jgi:hypothetical protein
MKCSVKLQGRRAEFESPHTDDEAILALRTLVATRQDMNDFARDMLRMLNRRNRLSRSQLDWIHWFALNPNE